MEEQTQHIYPISKQVIGGDVMSLNLSPKQFNAYRDEQDALRNLINAKSVEAKRKPIFTSAHDDFSNYHIVPIEDGKFKIVKREKPLAILQYDNDGQASVIANLSRMNSDRIGLNHKRGKYNDAGKLFDADTAGLEVGEVQVSSGAGNGFYG